MMLITKVLSALGVVQTVYAEGADTGLDTFFTNGGKLIDFLVTNVPKIVNVIMGSGLLSIGFYLLLGGFVIGIIQRVAGSR